VRPGETGTLFRAGDVEALAERCVEALRDPDGQRWLGEQARRWVERERQWSNLVERYPRIYEEARARRVARTKGERCLITSISSSR
jgi:glycosyltransferase involved in cell wall biosynthesis